MQCTFFWAKVWGTFIKVLSTTYSRMYRYQANLFPIDVFYHLAYTSDMTPQNTVPTSFLHKKLKLIVICLSI